MTATSEFGSLRHLVGRFFGALWPAGPPPRDDEWARGWLLPGEQELWARMSGPDRRHAVGVARGTIELLAPAPASSAREVVASALLHDVGKVTSGMGTLSRALVTAAGLVVGREGMVTDRSARSDGTGWRSRARLYLTHDREGAELLERAGSHPLTVAWALEHHRPASAWTVERRVADALKAADGD